MNISKRSSIKRTHRKIGRGNWIPAVALTRIACQASRDNEKNGSKKQNRGQDLFLRQQVKEGT